MEEKNEIDKADEVMLPGFRFHPTDEELVGFYLKRKIQQKPLSIELIRQLDIYKYDPWDLPKELATTGEKEWYFYCPRDRKYRNSARPNRVTGAGFWKATGTDRPIYSSEGTKCIGLKKSLVFYKGRAAKGVKTDWMMHEYRLPSLTDSSISKRPVDKNIPANEAWAICRIFKKTNSTAQRALSHSWVPPVPLETTDVDVFSILRCPQFGSENTSCTTGAATQLGSNNALQHRQQPPVNNYTFFDVASYRSSNLAESTESKPSSIPTSSAEVPTGFMFSPPDQVQALSKFPVDVASLVQAMPPPSLGNMGKNSGQQCHGFTTVDLLLEMNGSMRSADEEHMDMRKNLNASQVNSNQWGTLRSVTFPLGLSPNLSDVWRPNLTWDSSPTCPNETSTNKCYT
ncbi:hypothetical protein Taro_020573 [Colocasia esculenta]|uniref:NAC domain-containing protein n=1 Tax=Colocasia esculenta TaxID=4460 RepID=A0A843UWR2_COLES|nr:hypothetical protein [Colocasia esculenta]